MKILTEVVITSLPGLALFLMVVFTLGATEARSTKNIPAFCSQEGELLISSLQTMQATKELFEAFCSRRDVQRLLSNDTSCLDYVRHHIQGHSKATHPSKLYGVQTAQGHKGTQGTIGELLSGSVRLSHRIDELVRTHNHCECPMAFHHRSQCTDKYWIHVADPRYCLRTERHLGRTSALLFSMATLKHQMMIDHGLPIPPLEDSFEMPAGWARNTNVRLTSSLIIIYGVMEHAQNNLRVICSVCNSDPHPLCKRFN